MSVSVTVTVSVAVAGYIKTGRRPNRPPIVGSDRHVGLAIIIRVRAAVHFTGILVPFITSTDLHVGQCQ